MVISLINRYTIRSFKMKRQEKETNHVCDFISKMFASFIPAEPYNIMESKENKRKKERYYKMEQR